MNDGWIPANGSIASYAFAKAPITIRAGVSNAGGARSLLEGAAHGVLELPDNLIVSPLRCRFSASRLLPGEPEDTTYGEDARYWAGVYRRLIVKKEHITIEIAESVAELPAPLGLNSGRRTCRPLAPSSSGFESGSSSGMRGIGS